MRKRFFAGALGASAIGLVVLACNSDDYDGYPNGGPGDPCNQLTSCGACTPVNGCGWCATGPSQGLCASDPDECAQAQSFSWTWSSTGCFVAADASVAPTMDAGTPDAPDAPPPATLVDSGAGAGDSGEAGDTGGSMNAPPDGGTPDAVADVSSPVPEASTSDALTE